MTTSSEIIVTLADGIIPFLQLKYREPAKLKTMWFKKQSEYKDLLQPIKGVFPLLKKDYTEKGRIIKATEYSKLHDRYVLTLEEIKPNAELPKKKPVSMRVVESDKNGYIAIHDVSPNNKKPRLFMTFFSESKFENFEKAIEKIKIKNKDESKGELRVLNVPALNVEALWLHFQNGEGDVFAITANLTPKDEELLTEGEFVYYLNFKKNNLGYLTDETGA